MKRDRTGAESICHYLRDHPEGATAGDIARDVLHLTGTAPAAQEKVVAALLKDDDRVFQDEEGRWRIRTEPPSDRATSFVVAALRIDRRTGEIIALSLQQAAEEGPGIRIDLDRSRSSPEEWENAPQEVAALLDSGVLVGFDQRKTARAVEGFVGPSEMERRPEYLSLQRLGKRVLALQRNPSLQELCDHFGVAVSEEESLSTHVETLAELFHHLREEAEGQGLGSTQDLLATRQRQPMPVDFSRYAFSPAYLAGLPRRPGVYVMRDQEGRILYVGKTRNLRSRVSSYFHGREHRPAKISRILDQLYHLECVPVGSDLEAQLVEARRIRLAGPEVNVQRRVHSRRAKTNIEENFIAVLPSAEPDHVELFLFARGLPLRQLRMSVRLEGLTPIRRILSETYYQPTRLTSLSPDEQEDVELARRHVARHRDSIVRINVDHAAGLRDLIARLKEEVHSFASRD